LVLAAESQLRLRLRHDAEPKGKASYLIDDSAFTTVIEADDEYFDLRTNSNDAFPNKKTELTSFLSRPSAARNLGAGTGGIRGTTKDY
jgi:hypothetical protein